MGRARRLLGDDVEAVHKVAALLDVLAEHGDIADKRHGDVLDVRAWTKRQTTARLARWLTAAEAWQLATGEGMPRRGHRGDIVRLKSRPFPRWRNLRDH